MTVLRLALPYYLAFALVINPFLFRQSLSGNVWFYDNQRLIEISCAIFALGIITFRLTNGVSRLLAFNRTMTQLLVSFFLLGLISSAFAYSPRHAFFGLANFLLLLGVAWIVASEISIWGDVLLEKLLFAGGLACAFYLLFEVAIYIYFLKMGQQPNPRLFFLGFDNHRSFNSAQTISLPLLGLMAARLHDPGRKAFWWGGTVLWWMLLFLSAGRGTFVGLIVGIALAWITLRPAATSWCRAMLLAGVAGLAAYLFFYAAIPLAMGMEPFGFFFAIVERTQDDPTSGRLQLWARALDTIYAHPLLGTGPLHFAHYGRDLQSVASPHNWILLIASEWGLAALLLLSTALALSMRKLWKLRTGIAPNEGTTLTALLVTGVAILVDSLASDLIEMPTSQLWIAMYLGCAWGWAHRRSPAARTINHLPSRAGRIVIILSSFGILYAITAGVWPELKAQFGPVDPYAGLTILMPRIFLNGTF